MLRRRCEELGNTVKAFAGVRFSPTTSGGCSPPRSSTPACRSTSAQPCSGTWTCEPLLATWRCSRNTSSGTTRSSSPAAGRPDLRLSTGRSPTRSGPSSRATSISARSNWAPACAPTAPPASTSTPACAAPCSRSTRRCWPAWTNSNRSPRAPCPGRIRTVARSVEGIDLTLTFLRGKQEARRAARRPAISLGMPRVGARARSWRTGTGRDRWAGCGSRSVINRCRPGHAWLARRAGSGSCRSRPPARLSGLNGTSQLQSQQNHRSHYSPGSGAASAICPVPDVHRLLPLR